MSVSDDIVALIEAGEEHAIEVDGPDPVVDLLQANVVLLEGVGDEQQPVFEAEGTGVRDALDQRRAAALELVRPFVVVLAAEVIEAGGE